MSDLTEEQRRVEVKKIQDCLEVLEEVADPPSRPLPKGLPEIFYRFGRVRNNRRTQRKS